MKWWNVWRVGDVVFWRIGPRPRGWITWRGLNGITISPWVWLLIVMSLVYRRAPLCLVWLALSSPDPVLVRARPHSSGPGAHSISLRAPAHA